MESTQSVQPKGLSNLEKFGLFSGIVGLVVDVIGLLGIIFGIVIPQPEWGFWSKPGVITTVSFTLLVYGLTIIMFFIIQVARNR